MDRREYSAGAVKHSFWFMEFRKVVSLRSEGMSWDDIRILNEKRKYIWRSDLSPRHTDFSDGLRQSKEPG